MRATPTGQQARFGFARVLLVITILAAIPYLLLAATQYVEYDGYWHLFIAQLDNWSRFLTDLYGDAHPPLYILLLRVVLVFGRSLLIYRSITLIAGMGSVFTIGWIARKVTGSEMRAYQTALAYGFALPTVITVCEVRSYMLSAFFALLSLSALLEIAGNTEPRAESRARKWFVIWTILACLSEYVAFFYAGAALLVLAGSFIANLAAGRRPRLIPEILTALPILLTIGGLYAYGAHFATIQGHLLPYYFDPQGTESVTAFVFRNTRNFLNQFLPMQLRSTPAAVWCALIAVAAGLLTGLALRGLRDTRARLAQWTLIVTAISMAALVAAGIAGKYPYGGDLRQQFLLFPFLVLCLAVVVEQIATVFGRHLRSPGRLTANLVIAAVVAGTGLAQYLAYPKSSVNVLADRLARFNQVEPSPKAVYLDQFNLITFFIYHQDWKWTLEKQQPIEGIDVYRVRKGDHTILVLRDLQRWNLDPEEEAFYGQMQKFLQTWKIPAGITIFDVRQVPPGAPYSDVKMVRASITKKAFDAAVCLPRNWLDSMDWFATFTESGCEKPAPVPVQAAALVVEPPKQTKGKFDNTNDALEYVGAWTHQGALSSSADAGAVVRLAFEGTAVDWTYAKGPDHGIAAVRIDGKPRPDVDLYNAKPIPRASTSYADLPPGKHTFELVVTGKKAAESSAGTIDLNALSVH